MSRPHVLLGLSCARRCYLGSVVALDGRLMVVMAERAYVATDLEHDVIAHHDVGPYALDEIVSFGCLHGNGVLDAQQRADIVRKVEEVRAGSRPPGGRHAVRRGSGIVG